MEVILALDLGANTGYCLRGADGSFLTGKVYFKSKGGKHKKYHKFSEWLKYFIEARAITSIYYERVDFGLNVYASQAHGAYVATIHNVVNSFNATNSCYKIHVGSYGVAEIKKALTGMGNASKMGMIHYAEKFVDRKIEDDNIADAVGVMKTALNDPARKVKK